jgi:uncharacterized protein YjeT (DUF2065 family)
MPELAKLLGIAMVILGAVYLAKPATMKKYLHFWAKGNRLYLGGALNIFIAIILLSAAPRCVVPWVIFVFGIVSLVKGGWLFIAGPKKAIILAHKFEKKPLRSLRIYSVLTLVLGILLVYSA